MTKLFHADSYIPATLRAQAEQMTFRKLVWSRHAQLELIRDSYGMIPANQIPHSFNTSGWALIEIEVADEKYISKLVFRRPVDVWRSLVIVLRPSGAGIATVVTTWTNLNTDKHKTLDRSKYATA